MIAREPEQGTGLGAGRFGGLPLLVLALGVPVTRLLQSDCSAPPAVGSHLGSFAGSTSLYQPHPFLPDLRFAFLPFSGHRMQDMTSQPLSEDEAEHGREALREGLAQEFHLKQAVTVYCSSARSWLKGRVIELTKDTVTVEYSTTRRFGRDWRESEELVNTNIPLYGEKGTARSHTPCRASPANGLTWAQRTEGDPPSYRHFLASMDQNSWALRRS